MTNAYLYKGQDSHQRTYRTVAIVMFAVAIGTMLVRLFVGYVLPSDIPDLASDAIFTVMVQIGLFLVMPALIYKFVLGKNFREIKEFSNMRKTKWYNLVIAVLIGVCAMIATIGISLLWQVFLIMLGYIPSSPATDYPAQFNIWMFLIEMLLTAFLPGFCEEFLIRGGILSTMRRSFAYTTMLWIMAIIFGLFHQNILQVFYTGCFGMFMAFLTTKMNSIYPSMIIHTVNNGLSVYIDYAEQYKWKFLGNFSNNIREGLLAQPGKIIAIYLAIVAIGVGLVVLMLLLKGREKLSKQKEIILDSGFDQTNGRVVMFGPENKELVEEIGMQKAVYGSAYVRDEPKKPSLRDNAFVIGALVVTILTTVSSFIWGLF